MERGKKRINEERENASKFRLTYQMKIPYRRQWTAELTQRKWSHQRGRQTWKPAQDEEKDDRWKPLERGKWSCRNKNGDITQR